MTADPSGRAAGAADAAFVALAGVTLDELLEDSPELATTLGDHRFDDRLADATPAGLDAERGRVARRLRELDDLGLAGLTDENRVDAGVLRNRLEHRLFELDVLRPHEWDPLHANPGTALYLLLARDFAPLGDRLRSLTGRLRAVPAALAEARRTLSAMPRVHVETAIGQFTGTRTLLATELERALEAEPSLRGEVDPARTAAYEAVDAHLDWLRARLDDATGDPRIGAEKFERKLALALDTTTDPDALLARAEADLEALEERIAETAARAGGHGARSTSARDVVRGVLDDLAADGHVTDATIVGLCEAALERTTQFVREHDLVTVYDDAVEIIVMPEIHRGVAVAYCDPPGPLESRPLPTYFAVAPTPEEWPAERVTSFYREYNAHMLHNLTVHEAMPGHVLQLAHSSRYAGSTPLRSAFWSGSFVEGWAVYAEQLMADRGYTSDGRPEPLRMQQLKMQLRMTINTILDVRVHVHGMTEDEAMDLMLRRGYQEEGEAVGKWRRALLSSAQLSTYYVGYTEVSDLVAELRPRYAGDRELHDAVLSLGSPAARHLRTLLLPGDDRATAGR